MHEKGYVHQDIKPSNIMLNSQNINNLVIIDFGRTEHVQNKVKKGTLLYNAPEVNNKYNKIDQMNVSMN